MFVIANEEQPGGALKDCAPRRGSVHKGQSQRWMRQESIVPLSTSDLITCPACVEPPAAIEAKRRVSTYSYVERVGMT